VEKRKAKYDYETFQRNISSPTYQVIEG